MRITDLELGPLIAASGIVLVGVAIGLGFAIRAANRRVQRLEAEPAREASPYPQDPYRVGFHAQASSATDAAPLYYVLSALFWPVALGLGIHFLRDRKTARMGRGCLLIGISLIGAVTLLTCVGVVVGGVAIKRSATQARQYPRPLSTPTAPRPYPYATAQGHQVVRGRIGEPAMVGDLQVTVIAVDRSFMPTRRPLEEAGRRYVTFDVSFRNLGDRIESVGAHQFQLFDAEGHVLRSYYLGKTPTLSSVQLTPGNLARGWVTFELTPDSAAERLQIMVNDRTGQHVAELRID